MAKSMIGVAVVALASATAITLSNVRTEEPKQAGTPAKGGVDSALHWLAVHQEPDGHWDSKKYNANAQVDTAVTGFALLALIGAGNTEKGGPYKDNVQRAVAWMKANQAVNGLIYAKGDGGTGGPAYGAAIATLAMAEAAAMAHVPETVAAAQKAINYCIEIHQPGPDLFVSGWYIMALKSAKVAGLHVDPASFDVAIKFLDSCEEKNVAQGPAGPASRYHYQPNVGAQGLRRTSAICCVGRQFLGWKKEDLRSSVEYFVKQGMPEWGANGESVDLCYWYNGMLCVFQQGGELWKKWSEALKSALCDNQCKQGGDAGSWNPVGVFSANWGRVGQTAMGALSLEIYYRYRQSQPDTAPKPAPVGNEF